MAITERDLTGGPERKKLPLRDRVHGSDVLVLGKDRKNSWGVTGTDRFSAVLIRGALTDYYSSFDYVPRVVPNGTKPVMAHLHLLEGFVVGSGALRSVEDAGAVDTHGLVMLEDADGFDQELARWASGPDGGQHALVGDELRLLELGKRLSDHEHAVPATVGKLMLHMVDDRQFPPVGFGSFS